MPVAVQRFIDEGYGSGLALALDGDAHADVAASLRHQRYAHALMLALADLAGEHDLEQTVLHLSDFADDACERALVAAFDERAPGEPVRGMAIIALGKMGSRELNYSSDIDPIIIYDPETLPRRARDDPGEAATRIARRWVDILSARGGGGHVLRVDLRLRPSPEVTPIALPVDAAISYYESQALAWEQAAFIRARCAAGDRALGDAFLAAIRPFVWRSARDYGQLRRIGDMSAKIRDHYDRGQQLGPGFDVKRGRGGIREVEFFAQSQQLIHGGRRPDLRAPRLRDALAALSAADIVDTGLAARLYQHYALLRTVEHRLQMIDDQQTHSLPLQPEALDRVAHLHGLANGAALVALLRPTVDDVARHYDQLLAGLGVRESWPLDEAALEAAVAQSGFPDPGFAVRRIGEWRSGSARVLRSAAARESLEPMLPGLIGAMAAAPDPVAVLTRFDAMLGGLPSAINLFDMLAARPPLLASLVAILAHAPTLSDQLGRRAALLEGLIDASAFAVLPDAAALLRRFRAAPPDEDYERLLDRIRREVGELRFAIGAQLIEGVIDPLDAARAYADIADAALEVLASATIAEFEAAHGRIAGGELLILALGRYGGRGLTHASDLDLILLFTGDHLAESDGRRPLGATSYFNRLAQRVIAALSVATAEGPLYEVDTRLRPQGNQGPLCASVDAFARYQREDAWTWEHLALTRARVVFGSSDGQATLEAIIAGVLDQPRDASVLLADAAKMLDDIHRHKPANGPLDVKLVAGGLIDAEMAIHVTQLTHRTGFSPDLLAALAQLQQVGLAPAGVDQAIALQTRMLVALRLMARDGTVDSVATRERVATACRMKDWDDLVSAASDAQHAVRQWGRALGLISDNEKE